MPEDIDIDQLIAEVKKGMKKATSKSKRQKKRKPHVSGNGYVYGYDPDGSTYLVHRRMMEDHLGRKLASHEAVFFINGDKKDLRIENLQLGIKQGRHEEIVCPHCDKNILDS